MYLVSSLWFGRTSFYGKNNILMDFNDLRQNQMLSIFSLISVVLSDDTEFSDSSQIGRTPGFMPTS